MSAPLGNLPCCSHPWAKPWEQVAQELQTGPQHGLSSSEVEKRRKTSGYNELDKQPGTPVWLLIAQQFDDTLVKVGCLPAEAPLDRAWWLMARRLFLLCAGAALVRGRLLLACLF